MFCMEFFVFWVSSIIISTGIELRNRLRLFKDIANKGYKLDLTKEQNISKNGNREMLLLLVPVINLLYVMESITNYKNSKSFIIDELDKLGQLKKMNLNEKEKYLKNPTSLNALFISVSKDKDYIIQMLINTDKDLNKIRFKLGKNLDDITIIENFEDESKLSLDEKNNIILELVSQCKTKRDLLKKIEKNNRSEYQKMHEKKLSDLCTRVYNNAKKVKLYEMKKEHFKITENYNRQNISQDKSVLDKDTYKYYPNITEKKYILESIRNQILNIANTEKNKNDNNVQLKK